MRSGRSLESPRDDGAAQEAWKLLGFLVYFGAFLLIVGLLVGCAWLVSMQHVTP